MLRILAYLYFLVALTEFAMVPLGKFELPIGAMAGATSIFFGAVLLGLAMILEEMRARR